MVWSSPPQGLEVITTPNQELAYTNCAFVADGLPPYVEIGTHVFSTRVHKDVPEGKIALSSIQRKSCGVQLSNQTPCKEWVKPPSKIELQNIQFEIDFFRKRAGLDLDYEVFEKKWKEMFVGQVFTPDQDIPVLWGRGDILIMTCKNLGIFDEDSAQVVEGMKEKHLYGLVTEKTQLLITVAKGTPIKLTNTPMTMSKGTSLFSMKFDFETIGIGGLGEEMTKIFRRAFASRVFPASVVQRMGLSHVKGILLHGPPGTGKTLIARQIGKMLNCAEPKIVNGPEILSKFVGQAEENIRNLFKDAEIEQREKGDESELHLIIFDELDAICKQRGSVRDGTGVHDSIVNQLLSKIDGVEALNNVILIGMTNRPDLLDPALKRPGRFEVQIEIGLPDEAGRLQIFIIHTAKIRNNNFLSPDVDLKMLAAKAKNFSGAEIEGLVRSAVSFAFGEQIDINDLTKTIDPTKLQVTQEHFMKALDEIHPAFGVDDQALGKYIANDLIPYGPKWIGIEQAVDTFIKQVQEGSTSSVLSLLLHGPSGSGKTALAAHMAIKSAFPFAKIVSGENMIGYGEISKVNMIRQIFDDAYKSPLAVVILDDIERLIEWAEIGPRYSNAILQSLLVLLKKPPKEGKKMLIVGTTSQYEVLQQLELANAFSAKIEIGGLTTTDEIQQVVTALKMSPSDPSILKVVPSRIGIKTLILVCEMASVMEGSGDDTFGQPSLVSALNSCGCDVFA